MTEQTEAAGAPDVPPELEIEHAGRKFWVRMPSPEQLLVWKRTLRQLQGAEIAGWNAEQVMVALERTRKIIDSVLIHSADVTWLDDEMLAGNIDLMGTAEIIQKTVEAFVDAAETEGNRETRRAAKKAAPAKKAARKKAAGRATR
jgi:hypothetical protein